MVTDVKTWLHSLFRQHFQGVYSGILHHGFKGHLNSTLSVRGESMEYLLNCLTFARLFEDLEIVEQRGAIADHIEDTASRPALAPIVRAEEGLREEQPEGIRARRNGEAVGEVPVPLPKEQFGVLRAAD